MRQIAFLIILTGSFLAPLSFARADETLQQQYLDIYLKINSGEDLQKKSDYANALGDFQDCYDKLAEIHRVNPDWESRLVTTRMDYCKAKIDDLKSKVPSAP